MKKSEAAQFLGVSTRTVERLVAKGRLRPRREKGKTRPILVFDQAELSRVKKELQEVRPEEVFGRPNTLKPKDAVGFRIDPHYYKRLEEEGGKLGLSAGEYARRLVVRGLEVGDELSALRKSLGHMFYLILVTKLGASEAEAEDIVRNIEGGV
ncbi:MAG: helix-turn-helix domain-containing protein [Fimbriimonadaceae bacterium]|nr:helix-turn-helix domain-containing protein [Fimbriimonadaceae bacterium]